jgi:GT2 family glycosyltransferase
VPLAPAGSPDLDVSFVMVNHNHGETAEKAVLSLAALADRARFELIFVDNRCSDGLADRLAASVPAVCIVRNDRVAGFAANSNRGFAASAPGSRYVALLNPDTECLPGVVDALVTHLDANPDVGIAGPRLLNADGSRQASARRFITVTAMLMRALHVDRVMRVETLASYMMTDADQSSPADVDWVTGAFLVVRRAAVADVGLLDEGYFLYAEDQDWCCRMWRAGWRVAIVPDAVAVHGYQQEGYRKPWSASARLQLASALRMFWKFRGRLSRRAPSGPADSASRVA